MYLTSGSQIVIFTKVGLFLFCVALVKIHEASVIKNVKT